MSNLNIETVSEIAESVYFSVIDELDLTDECINFLIDGSSENTMRGQELYFMIESAIESALESEGV